MPTITEHFDQLTDLGLKVIPLKVNSKAPMTKAWQKDWNWKKSREKLIQYPDANIGLLLGEIIDVEGDDEHSNRILLNLIGDYPHPCYRSTRSVHHLFKSPDPDLKLLKHNQIEFRGFGHQSVLPPSQHFGVEYCWITQKFPIPEMPNRLRRFFDQLRGEKKAKTKPGCLKVWCSSCREECRLHQKRFALELKAFNLMGSNWECQKCRTIDMRPLVRALRGNN
jgi:hypothetical protein